MGKARLKDISLLIEPFAKAKIEPANRSFHGRWGAIITENRIKHFMAGNKSWRCKEGGEELFDCWMAAINLVWPKDRFYVACIHRPLKSLNRWMSRIGIKEAVKVVAGKDVFLVISGQPFPGGKRTRIGKVFEIMKGYLFADHGQKRRISTTRAFRGKLRGIVRDIPLRVHCMLNCTPKKFIHPFEINTKLNLGLVRREKMLARAWGNKKAWQQLRLNWPLLPHIDKASVLKELSLRDIVALKPPGKEFIEKNTAIFDFILENPNIHLEGQERSGEGKHDHPHLAETKGI